MRLWLSQTLFVLLVMGISLPGYSDTFKRINVNEASAKELVDLPGIGPKKAEAIVLFRERRPFTRVSQLLKIKGIGRKTLKKLRPLIVIQGPPVSDETREVEPVKKENE